MDDNRALVAPELRPWLDIFPKLHLADDTLALMRAPAPDQRAFAAPALSPAQQSVQCDVRFIKATVCAPDVRVLIYTPPGAATGRPAYLHMHGGGFVLGMPEINDGANRTIALEHHCVVVSVDYRLAPETIFPGALEDCYTVLGWIHRDAETLGVDRARIAIGGESAGASHAASLALLARDRGEFAICFQLLDSAALDDRTGSGADPHPFCGTYVWTAAHNRFGWRALLGTEPGGADVPAKAVPARAASLAGLPPTFMAIGALDLFLEENIEYARRLIRAGVSTELHIIPGAFHGFAFAGTDAPQARALMRYRSEALARAFAQNAAS
jgi:triacylglycerol lipase